MCEWLSREEWCDTRLLCGGRAFGAHRAVLASVSSFLKRILLSCPVEETPTLIVLPDFDIEALSAVLYYIYNGEVAIPKPKLEKFLEIVKALQIFIDRQYLTQLSLNIDIDNVNKTEERTFVLRSENDDNKPLVTLRKLFHHTTRITKDATDYRDMQARNWNEQFKPVLGNLQPAYGDRQRDYFLRDSFMETYPPNRNANGLATGVPAIPNGCYRAPTSLLLTNANAKQSPDTVNLSYDNTDTASQPYNLKVASKIQNPYQDNVVLRALRRKLSTDLNDAWKIPVCTSPVGALQRGKDGKPISYLDGKLLKTYTAVSHSITNSPKIIDKLLGFPGLETTEPKRERSSVAPIPDVCHNKVAILNKALDSPWCPRLPNSFRPFRRKAHILNTYRQNDDNNNVQTVPSVVKQERPENVTGLHNVSDFSSSVGDEKEDPLTHIQPNTELSSRSRYKCNECGKTFSQLRNFKYHMSVHRGTREFAASCSVCGKSFNDRGYLSSHMKIHRNRKEYKCSQCPKSFNQRVAYNMHVRIHTGVKPHVCPTCGKAFSRKMLLKQHQRTHSGERPYGCPHCEKRFADRSNMTLHLRLHTGVKPFKCPMCPKSFTKKHHLKSHVNFHTGAKPYSCPRCRLAFTQSSNMRTHLKRCTAPEPTAVTDNATESTV